MRSNYAIFVVLNLISFTTATILGADWEVVLGR